MSKPTLTDLRILVSLAQSDSAERAPVHGERAAFKRLHASTLITRSPPSAGCPVRYRISAAGLGRVGLMVELLDNKVDLVGAALRRMAHDGNGFWDRDSLIQAADLLAPDPNYDVDQWVRLRKQRTADARAKLASVIGDREDF